MDWKQKEANIPYSNLDFDAEPAPGPSAPKLDEDAGAYCESIPGPSCPPSLPPPKYDEEVIVPYPDDGLLMGAPTAPAVDVNTGLLKYTSPSLMFEDIYEACVRYADFHCCYSSRFAKQMKLTGIQNDCAFHYILETFGEKRESETRSVSYKEGDSVDGPSNGPPPKPWDMHVSQPTLFKDAQTEIFIPHTDEVVICWNCDGRREVTCSSCSGRRTTSCWRCNGSGRDSEGERCSRCSGSGNVTCSKCNGKGIVECYKCSGTGKLLKYKKLIVTWKNHPSQYVSNIRKLPALKFINVTGDNLFREDSIKLSPMAIAPDASVNMASARLLQAHEKSYRTEKVRMQRHSLRAIPFTVVKYKWNDHEGEFYIYGKEKEVYFEDYPTSCCCICC